MLTSISIHRDNIIEILKKIYSDIKLANSLGFKGGTALYLLYDLDRFSVDIDLDLISEESEKYVFDELTKLFRENFVIKEIYNKKHTIFYMVSYDEKSKNIKIEINKRIFGSGYEIKNYLGINLNVMVKDDMFSNKLVALYERNGESNRDIYDINFFLKTGSTLNDKIIIKRTNKKVEEIIRKCILIIERKKENTILRGIGELLSNSQKDFVKKNLKDESIFRLRKLLLNYEKPVTG